MMLSLASLSPNNTCFDGIVVVHIIFFIANPYCQPYGQRAGGWQQQHNYSVHQNYAVAIY